MSHWICCNSCFLPPSSERRLALTTCGHLICSICYHKGKRGECLICSKQCQVSPLTDQTSPEVKALFSNINAVAKKHFSEISKVVMFQARHQKRLLTHYQKRNEKLEEVLVKMKQEMQQMAKKLNEQSAYIAKLEYSLQSSISMSQMSHSSQTSHARKAVVQIPFNSPVSLSRHSSSSNIADNMEVDERIFKKPVNVPRLSLISPPHGGCMGTVPHRTSSQITLANHSTYSATVSRSQRTQMSPNVSHSQISGWNSPIFKTSQPFRHSSFSSQMHLLP
ncbi:probable E3 SUMO-protein ligase RNF212 isoform X2 [Dunckerocampus dactyliophorus]|uniref:probable E3 SUMO-protein ligase RNF212 isoform X2 n=1 Tax=Dunckerocampus dactyliophorus TaxID=161453 RepID=UPI002405453A|nr:probable E3 SUMO-protein ligase RNF212 isoform X2 [Dunckerocampus dactyliophorus]